MKNFKNYLSNGSKNRFGIWCYEWNGTNVLPNNFNHCYKYCDRLLAPSNFSKEIFLNSGIPESIITVIPHGINSKDYLSNSKIKLPTKKSFKILANIAQNHLRKNIPVLLEAYGKAFTDKDDVCLIIKGKGKAPTQNFDVSLDDCIKNYKSKYTAEFKLLPEYIVNMADLYNSIDVVFTMSHCEGFYFPGLEALAAGKLNIAPNYGGQLDFLDTSNSLLVSGKEVRAEPRSMYWEPKNNAIWFEPDIDDAVDKLREAFKNYEKLNEVSKLNRDTILKEYSWNNITSKIINLCQNSQ